MTKLPDQAPEGFSFSSASPNALGQSAMVGAVLGTDTYLDEPLKNVYMRGNVQDSPMGERGVVEKVYNEWLRQREAILALPSNAEGLNLNRVGTYLRKMGGRDVELRFLSPDDLARAADIARDESGDHFLGHYFQGPDIATVVRDTSEGSLEALNGPEFTESLAVHELGHAANAHHYTQINVSVERRKLRKPTTDITAQRRRMGSVVRTAAVEETYEGGGIEEAQAEFERGKYVVEVLGRPQGFRDDGLVSDTPSLLDKYTFKAQKPDGTVVVRSMRYAVEAAILDLMVECEPKLLAALRASKHSVEALRERARIMNSILPGSYQRMRKIDVRSRDPIVQKQRAATSRQLLMEVAGILGAREAETTS